ncbi:MAG: hypothetical protein GY906_38650 [bacterium]|nr:hypothetical protein [bacterium]
MILIPDVSAYLPSKIQQRPKDYFVYGAEFLPLAAGATTSFNINIQADSSFLFMKLTGVATDVANTTFFDSVPVLLTFLDTASGRQSQSLAIHWNTVVGDGREGFELPYPKYISPTSTFAVQAQNLDAANAFNLRLSLQGFKVF